MTDQATQKRYVCTIIETMWKRYNNQLRSEDHELVILAVPTYPANIEAVSALDLSDVNDLMAVFAKHREDHPDELHPIEPSPDDAQDEAGDGVDARDRGQAEVPAEQQMGTRHDGGGTPQVGAEPAPEQDEGDAAGDAMERPIFELIGNDGAHIKILSSGKVEGFDGRIINRIPQQIMMPPLSPEQMLDLEREYTRNPGHVTWMRSGTPSMEDVQLVKDLMKQVPKPTCDCEVGMCTHRKDCRQGPAEPFAKITPHLYSPDFQAMGDCRVCGHGPDKPWHT